MSGFLGWLYSHCITLAVPLRTLQLQFVTILVQLVLYIRVRALLVRSTIIRIIFLRVVHGTL
jgi:hypothetical protein